jgi:hypothetical protein
MRFLLCLLPFVAACSSSYMQRAEPMGSPGPEEAKVVFCRPSRYLGGAMTFPVWDGDKLLGFSESGGTFEYRCPPGEHFFIASGQTYKGMSATLAGGLVYYVWLTPRVGFLSAGVGLTPVRKEDAELLEQVRASVKENECRTLLPEKGGPYEANRRDTIREVLAEFRSGARTPEPPLRAEDGHRSDVSTPQTPQPQPQP